MIDPEIATELELLLFKKMQRQMKKKQTEGKQILIKMVGSVLTNKHIHGNTIEAGIYLPR